MNFKTGRLFVLWQGLQGSLITPALRITLQSCLPVFQIVLDFVFLTCTFWKWSNMVSQVFEHCFHRTVKSERWRCFFIYIHTSTLCNQRNVLFNPRIMIMLNHILLIFKLPTNLENHLFTELYCYSALPLLLHPIYLMQRLINISPFTDTIRFCLKLPRIQPKHTHT